MKLPIDPSTDVPDGFTADQRDQPGGFAGDPDIFDTWATSSLTPEIAGLWEEDTPEGNPADIFERIFPMDMRPQGHDIIRTWLFSTMTRSHHEFGTAPWTHAALSGWILDPDRKKMGKSSGNAQTPDGLLEQFGTDAVRYWAASGRPGVDTTFSEDQMKVGRKFANKLLNVSKFVLSFGDVDMTGPLADTVTNPVDQSMLAKVDAVIAESTAGFEAFDYARGLERTETFFWWFCDNYVELVKNRAYEALGADEAASARRALREALSAIQRLLAPFLPFATEEAWNWWNDTSIHAAAWPSATQLGGDAALIDSTLDALTLVRRAKSEAKVSQRAAVESLTISAPASLHPALDAGRGDLTLAGTIGEIVLSESTDSLSCDVVLAPAED